MALMRYLLLGGSGILGSGFVDAIRRDPTRGELLRLAPDWRKPEEAVRCVAQAISELRAHGHPATVIWAAGVGQVGASREEMAAERTVLEALCRALADLPAEQQRRTRLVFASSAGALHGGNEGGMIRDSSQPSPISAYGHEKQSQEELCRSIAGLAGVGVLICRYSNIYGLASGRLPGKGLIPAAIKAARLRQPMTIYVTPDTRRDYVYGPDAAATSLALAEGLDGGSVTTLVAQGTTRTVAEIVNAVGGILGRRVPATFAVRPQTALQPRTLMFEPDTPVRGVVARTPMAVAIHRMAHAPFG